MTDPSLHYLQLAFEGACLSDMTYAGFIFQEFEESDSGLDLDTFHRDGKLYVCKCKGRKGKLRYVLSSEQWLHLRSIKAFVKDIGRWHRPLLDGKRPHKNRLEVLVSALISTFHCSGNRATDNLARLEYRTPADVDALVDEKFPKGSRAEQIVELDNAKKAISHHQARGDAAESVMDDYNRSNQALMDRFTTFCENPRAEIEGFDDLFPNDDENDDDDDDDLFDDLLEGPHRHVVNQKKFCNLGLDILNEFRDLLNSEDLSDEKKQAVRRNLQRKLQLRK